VTDAYRFIAAEKANYPISLMSRMLGVSRQAFHAWERRPPSQHALEDAFLTERIREIHRGVYGVYGAGGLGLPGRGTGRLLEDDRRLGDGRAHAQSWSPTRCRWRLPAASPRPG
jgi:putative transposase